MKKIVNYLLVFGLLLGSMSMLALPAHAATIKKVKVNITVDRKPISSQLQIRIADSVQRVSEKILLGNDLNKIRKNKQYLEKTIQEVFNKVLSGYEVNSVSLSPAQVTIIKLDLQPLGQIVEKVELEIKSQGISPELKKVLLEKKPELEKKINKVLTGLPVEAMTWSQFVLEPFLNREITKEMEGFSTGIDFQWGKNTKIVISLQPQPPLIHNIEVELVSHSLPNFLLYEWKKKIEKQTESMVGLPVAFVQQHFTDLQQVINKELENNEKIKKYGLLVTPEIKVGEKSRIIVHVESQKYTLTMQGTIYLGQNSPQETEIKAHLGSYLGEKQEVFLQSVFYPNPVKMEWNAGYSYYFNKENRLEYKYNFTDKENHLSYQHALGLGDLIIDNDFTNNISEITYRRPLDEYFSLSFTGNSEGEKWVALTSKF